MCSIDQHIAISTFLHSSIPPTRSVILRSWTKVYLWSLGGPVMACHPLGLVALVTNLVVRPEDLRASYARSFYGAGLAFAAGHVCFVSLKHRLAKAVWDEKAEPELTLRAARALVRMNAVRICVADVPSWICIFGAVLSAVKV